MGKPAFPNLGMSYHGYIKLSYRTNSGNLQLNIVLYQGVYFWMPFLRPQCWGCCLLLSSERKDIIMSTENVSKNTETKMQFILDGDKELKEVPRDKCKPVEYPIRYKLKNAFEVFVRVDGTENYWISNYGRCVNNLNRKDKGTFFKHKEGKCNCTVFETEYYITSCLMKKQRNGKRKPDSRKKKTEIVFKLNTTEQERNSALEEMQKADDTRLYTIESDRNRRDTTLAGLVAETFLAGYKGRTKIWHKDGDETNNWYKNLLTVTPDDYKGLRAGTVTWQELNIGQEYIEYENKASHQAYRVYNGIRERCGYTKDNDKIRKCYDDTAMWQGWIDNPKSFVRWYLEHYYECGDEEMDVDKDLFGDGSGMYHPDFCCILPKGLNTLLANSKKHYKEGGTPENTLPLGVRYSNRRKKYYGEITFTGAERPIPLSEWDTPEEAFAEYRRMKQADILRVAAEYKGKIPDYIYKKLLEVEVEPY